MLYIDGVCFAYKKRGPCVLDNISTIIERDGIDVFLGHNGAGKTTLFLLLSGHLRPSAGSISFEEGCVSGRGDIALVPEKGGCFQSFTPYENLRFRYLLSGQPEAEMEARIAQMLELFGLSVHGEKRAGQLSCGLQKRLVIACALLCRPKLLLLDEPTNGVDPATNALLLQIFTRLNAHGTKILLNTHDLHFAAEIADRLTILNEGKIVARRTAGGDMDMDELKALYFQNTERVAVIDDAVL